MKNILLIGAGRFGRHIAVQLSQLGHQVMAVDTNEERISDVLPYSLLDTYMANEVYRCHSGYCFHLII